ncbi:hypothetical protein KCV00_g411, partial [Aureobasidium melanogenum]
MLQNNPQIKHTKTHKSHLNINNRQLSRITTLQHTTRQLNSPLILTIQNLGRLTSFTLQNPHRFLLARQRKNPSLLPRRRYSRAGFGRSRIDRQRKKKVECRGSPRWRGGVETADLEVGCAEGLEVVVSVEDVSLRGA